MSNSSIQQIALIIQSFGRRFVINYQNQIYDALTKTKRTDYVVGDQVIIQLINQSQVQIIDLVPRHNLLYRSDKNKTKIIASNIDKLLIVITHSPPFKQYFLDCCLINAEAQEITPIIIINKSDLVGTQAFQQKIKNIYQDQLGYSVITNSVFNLESINDLKQLITNQTSLLIGPSGVGKSSLTNALWSPAKTRINGLTKTGSGGTHTTTNATLYQTDFGQLIDCPGLNEFGLHHIKLEQLASLFPEFRALNGRCKFNNCLHLHEPDCKINQQNLLRYQFYQIIMHKLLSTRC